MNYQPTISLAKLKALQRRELLYVLFHGLARWLSLALVLLTISFVVDGWVDKWGAVPNWYRHGWDALWHDAWISSPFPASWSVRLDRNLCEVGTPLTLRVIMASVQGSILIFYAYRWLVKPYLHGIDLIQLAQRVEAHYTEYGHRLVTAIQLTHEHAQTKGMSLELIELITKEAELISARHHFVTLVRTKYLRRGLLLLICPLVLVLTQILVYKPVPFMALMQRAVLQGVAIPRDCDLQDISLHHVGVGDEVEIRYEVTTSRPMKIDDLKGTVRFMLADQREVVADLEFREQRDSTHALFATKAPTSSVNFTYRAWLGDGRTHHYDAVYFEARPVVTIVDAWSMMPSYVPLKPDGSRYAIEQKQGDLRVYEGGRARVAISCQKPISHAELITLRFSASSSLGVEYQRLPMKIKPSAEDANRPSNYAEVEFDLFRSESGERIVGYTIEATDEYQFKNTVKPLRTLTKIDLKLNGFFDLSWSERQETIFSPEHIRRKIEILEPEPPTVVIFPERYPDPDNPVTEDDIIEGLPIPPGATITIEYVCHSPIGFPDPTPGLRGRLNSPARLKIRVNDEKEERILPLDEVLQTPESGPYNLLRATFSNQAFMKKMEKDSNGIQFHGMPSSDPMYLIPRLDGGGVYFLPTKDIKKRDQDGSMKDLEVGDRLEYWIEVRDRTGKQYGKSDPHIKEIRSIEEVLKRINEFRDSVTKLQELEKRQLGVFQRPKK